MDTKMNQLTNQMSYYGGKSISIIQSGLNNNNNNTHNSKNSVNIIEAEEILEGEEILETLLSEATIITSK